MKYKIVFYRDGKLICETEGTSGEMLLQCSNSAGVIIDAPCGGTGRCNKCLVRLCPGGEEVLACRTPIEGDMEVHIPDESEMEIAASSELSKSTTKSNANTQPVCNDINSNGPLGVAFDIGTTTVVAHLMEVETGRRLATASGVNNQRPYGADVISRIKYCVENGHDILTQVIRKQLASLIVQICDEAKVNVTEIKSVTIAANTIMEHIAAGYSPVSMGTVPFSTVSLFGGELPAWEGLPADEFANIYLAPAVTAYVGGDITAGILAAELEEINEPVIFLDIGTNGEIALKYEGTYYCCATAAGPAFEGAEIFMGMAATAGAINHVKWEGTLELTVIGDGEPRGLCGSGLIDALAVLLETGAVDESGRLLDADEIDNDISKAIDKVEGKNLFRLSNGSGGVYMTAGDIRKLQLAKSAIAAGITTLLMHCGITESDIKSFVLAGGFGSFMNKESAARIGLFPKNFLPVTKSLGNTAGEGAVLALCFQTKRKQLENIRQHCKYIELSESIIFNEQFVEQMMFE